MLGAKALSETRLRRMRVGSPPVPGPRSATRTAEARKIDRTAAAPGEADAVLILGIPPAEFTPHVREAIERLIAEVEHMRRELDQQRKRIAFLERLADQDPLAPIANRRAFVRELSRMLSYAERYGATASVIYFDLDGLKEINDSHGHAAGDAALIKVVRIMSEHVRESDLVGRLGGDEFGIILAQADQAHATEKARSLCAVIGSDPLLFEGSRIALSLAFGVYVIKGGEEPGAALAEADKEMYARKHASRRSSRA